MFLVQICLYYQKWILVMSLLFYVNKFYLGMVLIKILEEEEEDEDKTNRKREKKKEVNNTDELVRLIDNSSFVVTSSPIKKSNQVLGISGKNINGILS